MSLRPLRFIGEPVEVEFDQPSVLEKDPDCPDRFAWRGTMHQVVETLSEWRDYTRRGRMARMLACNIALAARIDVFSGVLSKSLQIKFQRSVDILRGEKNGG